MGLTIHEPRVCAGILPEQDKHISVTPLYSLSVIRIDEALKLDAADSDRFTRCVESVEMPATHCTDAQTAGFRSTSVGDESFAVKSPKHWQ